MEGISDIRIKGFDEIRPPKIIKEPYINLYFELNHQASKDWCEDFNRLVAKGEYPIKIDPNKGLIIETWVRKPEELELVLTSLKKQITTCIENYIIKIEAETKMAATPGDISEANGEQGRLNTIVAGLKFEG